MRRAVQQQPTPPAALALRCCSAAAPRLQLTHYAVLRCAVLCCRCPARCRQVIGAGPAALCHQPRGGSRGGQMRQCGWHHQQHCQQQQQQQQLPASVQRAGRWEAAPPAGRAAGVPAGGCAAAGQVGGQMGACMPAGGARPAQLHHGFMCQLAWHQGMRAALACNVHALRHESQPRGAVVQLSVWLQPPPPLLP